MVFVFEKLLKRKYFRPNGHDKTTKLGNYLRWEFVIKFFTQYAMPACSEVKLTDFVN